MNIECCDVCKCQSRPSEGSFLTKEVIYRRSTSFEFLLCYAHSIELFKIGQEQFVLKYPAIIKDKKWDEKKTKKRFSSFA